MTLSPAARRGAWMAAALLLAGLLWLAATRIDLARAASEVRSARLGWLVLALACFASKIPVWGAQWHALAPASPRNTLPAMTRLCAIASSVHTTTWLLAGEAASVVMLVTRIGLSRAEALSLLAMDQALVGVAKVAFLLAAAAVVTVPEWMRAALVPSASVLAVLLAALVLAARYHEQGRLLATARYPRGAERLAHVGAALAPLRDGRRASAAFARALFKKAIELAAVLCVQQAFGVELALASALLVTAALDVATLVPVVPGNAGVYEGAVTWSYVHMGLAPELALGMAVAQHAVYFAAVALPGYLWLLASDPRRSAAAAA